MRPPVTYIYDFDNKTWAEHTFSSHASNDLTGLGMAWTTIQSYYRSNDEIYAVHEADWTPPISPNRQVQLYQWFNESAIPVPAGHVRTFPLDFDGKKTRKRLHYVRIYVNDQSFQSVLPPNPAKLPWRLTLRVNSETTGKTATFLPEYDSAYNKMVAGGTPVDDADSAELIVTDAALSPDTPIVGYTFDATIQFPDQTDRIYRLYAIEMGWSTLSEGQEDI